jgi:hypothetical protein
LSCIDRIRRAPRDVGAPARPSPAARHARHREVEDGQVERDPLRDLHGLQAILRLGDQLEVRDALEDRRHAPSDDRVVVGHQPAGQRRERERQATAVILDDELHGTWHAPQFEPGRLGVRVANDVGHALLGDAVDEQLLVGRQLRELTIQRPLDPQLRLARDRRGQRVERADEAEVIERLGAQLAPRRRGRAGSAPTSRTACTPSSRCPRASSRRRLRSI